MAKKNNCIGNQALKLIEKYNKNLNNGTYTEENIHNFERESDLDVKKLRSDLICLFKKKQFLTFISGYARLNPSAQFDYYKNDGIYEKRDINE